MCRKRRRKHHSRPQRPRSFWSAPRIATSGRVEQRKSAIHGLPVTLRMLWVKSDKFDWFWSQSIVFTNPFKTGMSLDQARGRDSWCRPKGARPLGTRMLFLMNKTKDQISWVSSHDLYWENKMYKRKRSIRLRASTWVARIDRLAIQLGLLINSRCGTEWIKEIES